ncbi:MULTISPECIES: HAD family acid phosphatase [unclassified Streptomyces]|uniref:HAD family acid phosphatase n=1 Tax=unclassified Streptomyces TaxID=2593676 RepID=UPI001F512655|nr:HAD family acid phosphatase [Streptomyces sp. GZWMJZ-114]
MVVSMAELTDVINAANGRGIPGGLPPYGGGVRDTRPLALFDLDNTLSDAGHRQHFLRGARKDWPGFFAAAVDDPPLADGLALVRRTEAEGTAIGYLTGRPERCRADTARWLAAQGLPEGPLWLRGDADRRPARVTKLERLRALARTRPVAFLADDDELVCRDAEAAGFRVVRAVWGREATELHEAQEKDGRT